jgi:hypothetical protein
MTSALSAKPVLCACQQGTVIDLSDGDGTLGWCFLNRHQG